MALPAPTPAAGPRVIGPGVVAWLAPDGGWGHSNSALVAGHGASLLVDTLWDVGHTASMLEGFRPQLETSPIQLVVNTHSDGDHWFGNQLFHHCEIVATAAAARRMKQHGPREMTALRVVSGACRTLGSLPVPGRRELRATADYFDGMTRSYDFGKVRARLPDATFSGKAEREIGGRRVRLIEVGPAHTSGDLVVHLPEERMVLAGDIVFQGVTPVLWDGSARNWIKACERVLRLEPEVVVPGHGPLTGPEGLEAMRDYWTFLRSAAQRHYEKAHPAARAALLIARSDEFRQLPFARWEGLERTVINVYSLYRRLMRRSRRMSVWERLAVLRKTAILAEEFGAIR